VSGQTTRRNPAIAETRTVKPLFQIGAVGALLLMASCAGKSDYEPGVWLTDIEQAKAVAAAKKLPVLLAFTGSDWCHWCEIMDEEIFLTPAFGVYAKDNLVLMAADFPMRKNLAAKTVSQNAELMKKYQIEGIPINLFIDEKGNELGRMKYEEGGAEKYIEHIKELLKNSKVPAGTNR
jgi:thiol:disulfide interchange protein